MSKLTKVFLNSQFPILTIFKEFFFSFSGDVLIERSIVNRITGVETKHKILKDDAIY